MSCPFQWLFLFQESSGVLLQTRMDWGPRLGYLKKVESGYLSESATPLTGWPGSVMMVSPLSTSLQAGTDLRLTSSELSMGSLWVGFSFPPPWRLTACSDSQKPCKAPSAAQLQPRAIVCASYQGFPQNKTLWACFWSFLSVVDFLSFPYCGLDNEVPATVNSTSSVESPGDSLHM